MTRRIVLMITAGVVLPILGVLPQLQARAHGTEYVVRVAPVDPIDPYRGAYVALTYPDLMPGDSDEGAGFVDDDHQGALFITLRREGEVWVAAEHLRSRPASGPYLACSDRDWQIRCGIESLFLSQDKARSMEREVSDGGALARITVDERGRAALLGIVGND